MTSLLRALAVLRAFILTFATVVAIFLFAGPALAADGGVIGLPDDWLSTDAATVTKIIGFALPLAIAFLLHRLANPVLKQVISLVAAAVTGSLAYLISSSGHGYNLHGFVNAFLTALVPMLITYFTTKKVLIEPLERTGLNLGKPVKVTRH